MDAVPAGFSALIERSVRGNADAGAFLHDICRVLHLWDDLIDKDKVVSDEDINLNMWRALVSLPCNRFYRANLEILNPILVAAIQNWMVANRMEDGEGAADMPISFIIRSSYVDLVAATALICGGLAFSIDIAMDARRMCHGETYDGYVLNLAKQKADAAALKVV